jgi:predicted DNA-binding protein (MmcQ/YjbR family)
MTVGTGPASAKAKKYGEQIRAFALSFPETKEDFPWGHSAFKVKNKAFVFMGVDENGFSMSVKLTKSNWAALQLPFCEPTHYGLGKHGWVSASFAPNANAPIDVLLDWVKESFNNVAPKTLLKKMESGAVTGKSITQKKAAVKKAPAASKKTTKKAKTTTAKAKPTAKKKTTTAKRAPQKKRAR